LKQQIKTDKAPRPVARYSQAIRVGNTLYIQGLIALDPETGKMVEGDIKTQATRIFESIKAILDAAGMDLKHVVKVTVFLSNLDDYKNFNDVYNSYFQSDPAPVRTTVQAKMPFDALVEVDAIACKE
jgi:2-iminobutanoate/2-iminopropanoate deaminase